MTLSWSADDDLSGFKIFVHSDHAEKHTEPLLSEKEDEQIRTMDATPMPSTEPRIDDSGMSFRYPKISLTVKSRRWVGSRLNLKL